MYLHIQQTENRHFSVYKKYFSTKHNKICVFCEVYLTPCFIFSESWGLGAGFRVTSGLQKGVSEIFETIYSLCYKSNTTKAYYVLVLKENGFIYS